MKNLIWLMPLAFIIGCGDKDEDTGEDTAAEDCADEVEDNEEGEDTGGDDGDGESEDTGDDEDTAGEE